MCVFSKLLRRARSVRWRVVALVVIAIGTHAGDRAATTVALPAQSSFRVFLTGPVWKGERNAMLCWIKGETDPIGILSWACPLLGGETGVGWVQLVDLLLEDEQAARLKLGLQWGNCAGEATGCSTAARLHQCTKDFLTSVDGWGKKREEEKRDSVTEADLAVLKQEAGQALVKVGLQTSRKNVGTLTKWLGDKTCSLKDLQKNCALRRATLDKVELPRSTPPVGPAPLQLVADVLAYRDAIVDALPQFGWIDPNRTEQVIAGLRGLPETKEGIVTYMLTNADLHAVVHSEDLFLYMKTLDVSHAHSLQTKSLLPVLFSRRDVCGLCRAKLEKAVGRASAGRLWNLNAPLLYLSQIPVGTKTKGQSLPDWILTGDGSELQPVPRVDDAPGHIPSVCLLRLENDAWIESAEVQADGTLVRCTLSDGTRLSPPAPALPH